MTQSSGHWPMGQRVIVTALSETPMEGIDPNVSIVEQEFPDTSRLKSTDVVIAVKAGGLSWVDLIMLSGQYQHMPRLPYCPGLEYSGVVAWAGSDVSKDLAQVGQKVFVDCFTVGPRTSGDYQSYGGFASYAVAPAAAVRQMPSEFDFEHACNFAGNYETAYHCLVTCGQLKSDETVLIHGASGSTGIAAVQIAKHLGATVIATGRSRDKLDIVRALGADHVLALGHSDGSPGIRQFRDDVKALTNGCGVDVVYDGVGGDISLESLRCIRFGGRFLLVGWASTPFVAKGKGGRGAPNANQLPTNLMLMKGLHVIGCPTVIATQKDPSIREKRVRDLMSWVQDKALMPYSSHRFAMAEVKDALRAKWRGDVIGGCIIVPPTA